MKVVAAYKMSDSFNGRVEDAMYKSDWGESQGEGYDTGSQDMLSKFPLALHIPHPSGLVVQMGNRIPCSEPHQWCGVCLVKHYVLWDCISKYVWVGTKTQKTPMGCLHVSICSLSLGASFCEYPVDASCGVQPGHFASGYYICLMKQCCWPKLGWQSCTV